MCDPVLSVHSQCIRPCGVHGIFRTNVQMEIVHHLCAVHRASCMLQTVRCMQRARTNLYATSCKRASRMYRSCSIHLSRTCTVHKMHGCHLQHGGTVSELFSPTPAHFIRRRLNLRSHFRFDVTSCPWQPYRRHISVFLFT